MTTEFAEIVLVRHGETDWNRVSRLQGDLDIPLNDTGREQCRAAARRLQSIFSATELCLQHAAPGPYPNEAGIYSVYASPLSRAKESAEIICDELQIPRESITLEPNLREWNAGAMKGSLLSEISKKFPRCWDAWRVKRDPHFEFEGGESFAQRQFRVESAIQRIADGNPGRRILIISHAGVIDDVFRRAKRVSLQNATHVQKLNAEVYILHVYASSPEGKLPRWKIVRWGPRTVKPEPTKRNSVQFGDEGVADDFSTEYA